MKEIKILFLYPPEQSWPKTMVKPNGSLAYPYLAGALRDINIESYVYDACVGNDDDNLDDFFYKNSQKIFWSNLLEQKVVFHCIWVRGCAFDFGLCLDFFFRKCF